jgi:hypothetical protein
MKRVQPCLTLTNYYCDYRNSNSLYGNSKAIKKAISYTQNKPLKALIEHGYYFGNFVPPNTFNLKAPIVTYSETRLQHLKTQFRAVSKRQISFEVITIGPYINYADSILNDNEKSRIKQDYGRIFLVFPSHSIEHVTYKYNIGDFLKKIEEVSRDFDSVFVCMYWKDIQDERYLEYKKRGYKIVTAGHRNDQNFLGRLKDIIDLSDMTMSNTVGTHVGYCVARNKPHYLFNQFQEVEGDRAEEEFKERKNQAYIKTRDEELGEVIAAFSNLSYTITNKQKRVVEKYWGKNEVKYHTISKNVIHND